MVAWQPYLQVRDEILVTIANYKAQAPSVLLQVLYFLQEGHVQYLLQAVPGSFCRSVRRKRGPSREDCVRA
jgi:hypothetical protein